MWDVGGDRAARNLDGYGGLRLSTKRIPTLYYR